MTRKRLITADRMRLGFPTRAALARLTQPYDDRDREGGGPASSVIRFNGNTR